MGAIMVVQRDLGQNGARNAERGGACRVAVRESMKIHDMAVSDDFGQGLKRYWLDHDRYDVEPEIERGLEFVAGPSTFDAAL